MAGASGLRDRQRELAEVQAAAAANAARTPIMLLPSAMSDCGEAAQMLSGLRGLIGDEPGLWCHRPPR